MTHAQLLLVIRTGFIPLSGTRMAIFAENLFMDLVAVGVTLLALLVAFFKWRFTYWSRRGVYAPVPSIPFGNAWDLMTLKEGFGPEFRNIYEDIKKKGKKYGGYYFFTKPIFVPADLDLIKQIMTTDFAHFTDHVNHVDEETDPLTAHLFGLKGQKWRNLRAKLSPTFTSGKMKMMFQTMVDCSKELVGVVDKAMKKQEPLHVKDVASRFTTDIIGSCAFGVECNSLKDSNSIFREYGKKIFDTSFWDTAVRVLAMAAPEVLGYFKVRTFSKDVYNFFVNLVSQTVTFREANNVVRRDFMHLLIQLKNNVKIYENEVGDLKKSDESNGTAKSNMSLDELAAQSFVFFVAGFETSSATMTFCLYELARQPKLQERLRDEINAVMEKHNGELTYEAIMEMTFMEKCVNETLRKYPPVPVHTRECTQTYHVPNSNVVLDKGSFVFIPVMGVQYDAEFYPNPEEFDPERFSEESKASRHSSAWTPFGNGPRTCIGLRFGIMQTKVGLATLLRKYTYSLNSKTEMPLTLDPRLFLLTATKDIWLNVEEV